MKRDQLKLAVIISFILIWFTGTAWAGNRGDKPRHPEQRREKKVDQPRQGPGQYQRPPSGHAQPSYRRPNAHGRTPYDHHQHGRRYAPRYHRPLPPRHRDHQIHAVTIFPVPLLHPLPALIFNPALIFSLGVE